MKFLTWLTWYGTETVGLIVLGFMFNMPILVWYGLFNLVLSEILMLLGTVYCTLGLALFNIIKNRAKIVEKLRNIKKTLLTDVEKVFSEDC